MDILNALVENVQNLSENMLSGINLTQPTEEQRISCIVSNFYKKICTRENIQNLLTKYQLQLFQIKEVNNETIRYANICSTRMGRVQQTLSEYAEQMNKLEQQFRPNNLNNWNVEIVQMGKEMNELEKQILQTELFIFELERIKEKKNNNIKKGINENIEDMTK
ncbi:hypothetical protein Mgra_00007515 [Meloidogyne graminicola]|uniref:Uncharacterized protein n=1 Tax=Meloidogyne graminicola TaxID=189291 RepID=A0A8S9ZIF7_9BILA|nr:hypothetical protein Mgra_00007515 [Meloidogyne graminicola]